MRKYGFFRVAAAVPEVNVADCVANAKAIVNAAVDADGEGARVVVTPEMSVTAYTCADLFHNATLIKGADDALSYIARETAGLKTVVVVGAPVIIGNSQYNCAVVIASGAVCAVIPKSYLPNYNEFYERRWWQPAGDNLSYINIAGFQNVPFGRNQLIEVDGVKIAVELCEDLWTAIPPSSHHALAGADIILNLSASDDVIGKYSYLRSLIAQQSARCIAAYIYAGAGYGESSTDLVFDGKAIIAENGKIMTSSDRWQTHPQLVAADIDIEALRRDRMHTTTWGDTARREVNTDYNIVHIDLQEGANVSTDNSASGNVDQTVYEKEADSDNRLLRHICQLPFVPSSDNDMAERCDEITNIQVAGLARRLEATHTKTLVIGISGGLDSTLALLVAVRTFQRLDLDLKGIIGITMPGFGTTGRTYNNALTLMKALGITVREIPIADAVNLHFRDIGHDPAVTDVTYENSQARERTQILMDVANQTGGMVLGTGDLSELALGWATYNGDHMSMYGVNAGVPKTLVRHLVKYFVTIIDSEEARTALSDIIDTPISPELTPAAADGTIAQKTEDLVGPYELHDFFLYYTLRYGFSPEKIEYLAGEAFPDRKAEIAKWIKVFFRRFFNQQFKRSCLPDGPKVGSVCLSPRGDWRMPSDASPSLWQ